MVKLLESGEGLTGEDDDGDDVDDAGEGSESGGKRKKGGKGGGGKKKPLPATYEPDQRSQGWLKVKKGGYSISSILWISLDQNHRLSGRSGRLARSRSNRRMVGSRKESRLVESDLVGVSQSRDWSPGSGLQM